MSRPSKVREQAKSSYPEMTMAADRLWILGQVFQVLAVMAIMVAFACFVGDWAYQPWFKFGYFMSAGMTLFMSSFLLMGAGGALDGLADIAVAQTRPDILPRADTVTDKPAVGGDEQTDPGTP